MGKRESRVMMIHLLLTWARTKEEREGECERRRERRGVEWDASGAICMKVEQGSTKESRDECRGNEKRGG